MRKNNYSPLISKLLLAALLLIGVGGHSIAQDETEVIGYSNIWVNAKVVPQGGGQVCVTAAENGLFTWKENVDFQQTIAVGSMMQVYIGFYYLKARPTADYTFAGWYEDSNGNGQLDLATDYMMSERTEQMAIIDLPDEATVYETEAEAKNGAKPTAPQKTIFAYFTRGAKVGVSYHQDEENGNCGTVFIDKPVNEPGDQITLRALPNDGFQFEYWQDAREMGNIVSRENPLTVTVQGGESYYAYFTATDAPQVTLPDEGGFAVVFTRVPWVLTDESVRAGAKVLVLETEDLTRTPEATYLDMTIAEAYQNTLGGVYTSQTNLPTIISGKGTVRFAFSMYYGFARKAARDALVQWSGDRGTVVKGENLYVYTFHPDLGAFITVGNSDLMINPDAATSISVPPRSAYIAMNAFDLVDDNGQIPAVIGLSPDTYQQGMAMVDQLESDARAINHDVYDLQGRRVGHRPQKGLYIQNGKKHLVNK